MKGKATWKPVGLSANKWQQPGPRRRPLQLPSPKRQVPKPFERSFGFRQAPSKQKP